MSPTGNQQHRRFATSRLGGSPARTITSSGRRRGRSQPDTRHRAAYGEVPSSHNEVTVVMAAPTPVAAPGRQ